MAAAVSILASVPFRSATVALADAGEQNLVPQKAHFLDQMLDRAVRAQNATPAQQGAGAALDEARRLRGLADDALKAGKYGEANQYLSAALRLLATQGPRAGTAEEDSRRRYADLIDGIAVHRETLAEATRLKGTTPAAVVDGGRIDGLLAQARKLADAGQHRAALNPLLEAHGALEMAVVRLRSHDTVVYRRVFATPQDELRFETARYDGNRQLIARALETQLPEAARKRLLTADAEARRLAGASQDQARAGKVADAIQTIERANGGILDAVMELNRD